MRNILEYPPTTAEIVECLRELSKELLAGEPSMGDMRPLLLEMAASIVQRAEFVVYGTSPPKLRGKAPRRVR